MTHEFNYTQSISGTFDDVTVEVTVGDLFTYLPEEDPKDDAFITFMDVYYYFDATYVHQTWNVAFSRTKFDYEMCVDALYDELDNHLNSYPERIRHIDETVLIDTLLESVHPLVKEELRNVEL